MKIALIGPTGFVGSEVLIEASKRGHDITAICRNPSKVPTLPGVTAVKADVLDHKQVAEAVAGHDIVVSCFNAGHSPKGEGSIYQDTIEGAYNIIRGTKDAGVRRLLWTGGGSSLFIAPGTRAIDVMDDIKEGKLGAVFPQQFLDMLPPEFKRWEALVPPDTKHEQVLPHTRVLSFLNATKPTTGRSFLLLAECIQEIALGNTRLPVMSSQ